MGIGRGRSGFSGPDLGIECWVGSGEDVSWCKGGCWGLLFDRKDKCISHHMLRSNVI